MIGNQQINITDITKNYGSRKKVLAAKLVFWNKKTMSEF